MDFTEPTQEDNDWLSMALAGYVGYGVPEIKHTVYKGRTLWVRDGDYEGWRHIPEEELKDWRNIPNYGEDKHMDYAMVALEGRENGAA